MRRVIHSLTLHSEIWLLTLGVVTNWERGSLFAHSRMSGGFLHPHSLSGMNAITQGEGSKEEVSTC